MHEHSQMSRISRLAVIVRASQASHSVILSSRKGGRRAARGEDRTVAMANAGADAKSQSVAKVLGRIMMGAGIAVAGVSVGTGIALGLYFVGRGIERHGISTSAGPEAPALGTDARTNDSEKSRSK